MQYLIKSKDEKNHIQFLWFWVNLVTARNEIDETLITHKLYIGPPFKRKCISYLHQQKLWSSCGKNSCSGGNNILSQPEFSYTFSELKTNLADSFPGAEHTHVLLHNYMYCLTCL